MKWSKTIRTILERAIGAVIAFGVAYVCFRLIGTGSISELKLASITTVVLAIAYLLSNIDYSQFREEPPKRIDNYFDLRFSLKRESGYEDSISEKFDN